VDDLGKVWFFFFSPFDTDDILIDNKKIPVWYGNNAPKKDNGHHSLRDTGKSKIVLPWPKVDFLINRSLRAG
jgi:hypothetical protein